MAPTRYTVPAIDSNRIIAPNSKELQKMASKYSKTTEFNSMSFISKIRSRSAKYTHIMYDGPNNSQERTINALMEYINSDSSCIKMIRLDRVMAQQPRFDLHCRLFMSDRFPQIAFMWSKLLFPCPPSRVDEEADMVVIAVPEWEERLVLVDPKNFITYVMGSDYTGEIKKAFLRMAMYKAKLAGGLGLHAGSKLIRVKVNGKLTERGIIMFGLSGTGKTTLTCHNYRLEDPESTVIRQDDVILMLPDTYCVGTENNFYIKTEGLEPVHQPLLYKAATSPNALLENVHVDSHGKVDFFNYDLTSNGRCVVNRSEMEDTDSRIDLPRVDIIIFITRRNDIVPPVAKLNPEQAAAFFMLGESIETSAGDPSQAGKSKRVVGTNPFIIGPEYEEGNRFYDLLRKNPYTECYLINTGHVGAKNNSNGKGKSKGKKITVWVTTEIIKRIAKNQVRWTKDPFWGYEIPTEIKGLNIQEYMPQTYYSQKELLSKNEALRDDRRAWLSHFKGLYPEIVNTI